MRDINLSQENLAVQWQYVKRNLRELGVIANFYDFEQKAHRAIDNLIQSGIYEEFAEQIGAKRYEHTPSGIDERKGEHQRRQKKFDNAIILSMILGLSERKQRKFFKAFIGDAVSHGTASKLLKNLEGDLAE